MSSDSHDPGRSALDPEVAEFRRLQEEAGLGGVFQISSIAQMRDAVARARSRFYPQVGLPVQSITDVVIPGAQVPLAARIVVPHGHDGRSATVLLLHGGGWVFGGLDSHEGHARRIANRTGAVVVNAEYRLAPEHPFPAAYDDAVALLAWVAEHAGELGGDPDAIAIAGDSAGGNLALGAALHATESGPALRGVLLMYPVTDLSGAALGIPERHYLGPDAETLIHDPRVSPALDHRVGACAPIVLGVGAHDFLFQDNLAFAQRRDALGYGGELSIFPSLAHGFFSHASVSRACEDAADLLCARFARLLS